MGDNIRGEAFADLPELDEVNRDFKAYVELWEKTYGGAGQASEYVMEWYYETLKDKDNTYIEEFNEQELTWGKMFKFRYDPMTKKTLPWYDNSPLIISLGTNPAGLCTAINLNYFPKEVKYWMVGEIFRYYEADIISAADGKNWRRATEQEEVQMEYELLSKHLKEWGLDFAIRQYYKKQMYELAVVSYEEWIRMVMVDWDDWEGISQNEIQPMYEAFVLRERKKK